ncbi:MAG: hypothetical protein IH623_23590 [Verrucomicrobia bacterium]|nr:hypothetical protein [Verrucomicrobiota bacterium]
MKIPTKGRVCDGSGVNTPRQTWPVLLVALMLAAMGFSVTAQSTNGPASTNAAPPRVEAAPSRLDEAAFRLIAERNIFNANRSGGTVRPATPTRRPTTVETFALVGTMAYEKGTFAFFEGSRSEFTKVLKADGIIAGHKLLNIQANSVKLEADGKQIELPVGSQMRREDEGAWQVSETRGGIALAASASSDSANRSGRSERGGDASRSRRSDGSESGRPPAATNPTSSADEAEILKRLMERRERESQ